MKKRMIALLLTLAMAVAMLIPVSAAVSQPDNTDACSHNWVDAGNLYLSEYRYIDVTWHEVIYRMRQICTKCALIQDNIYKTYKGSHNDAVFCTLCSHKIIYTIPSEMMDVKNVTAR